MNPINPKIIKAVPIVILVLVLGLGFYFLSRIGQDDSIESAGIDDSDDNNQTDDQAGGGTGSDVLSDDQIEATILQEGSGQEAKNGDALTVHYVGVLEDGTKFDSSLDRGTPFTFNLGEGRVIPGWDIGLVGMKIDEIRKLTIPSKFAYGDTGVPNTPIGPNATLIFEVQLLEIN